MTEEYNDVTESEVHIKKYKKLHLISNVFKYVQQDTPDQMYINMLVISGIFFSYIMYLLRTLGHEIDIKET